MSRQLPPLYALRAFEAAARLSSFTRAGEELSITQSAVSRHIRTLEDHFACRLFVRNGRSLQLTEAARVLLPGVREGFSALERACDTLRGEDDILRMKAPSTLTMRWLLSRLSQFRHLQPGNEVQLTSAWMDVDHVECLCCRRRHARCGNRKRWHRQVPFQGKGSGTRRSRRPACP